MKKALFVLIIISLFLTITGCGNKDKEVKKERRSFEVTQPVK